MPGHNFICTSNFSKNPEHVLHWHNSCVSSVLAPILPHNFSASTKWLWVAPEVLVDFEEGLPDFLEIVKLYVDELHKAKIIWNAPLWQFFCPYLWIPSKYNSSTWLYSNHICPRCIKSVQKLGCSLGSHVSKVLFSGFKCSDFLDWLFPVFYYMCSVANMRPLSGKTSHCKGSAEIAPCPHIFLQHFKICVSCTYYN